MASSQQYTLWFVNQSQGSGKVCVYQDLDNITFNHSDPQILAWLLTGANPSTLVQFTWTIDYDFAWFNYAQPRSEQFQAADVNTMDSIVFSHNQFGFEFQPSQAGSVAGQLSITTDNTIPSVNQAVVGIGMDGAGTFAYSAQPNLNFTFQPTTTLSYWISFGSYTFSVNDPLVISTLNPSAKLTFPYGNFIMTATLDQSNSWRILPGPPPKDIISSGLPIISYVAGKGIV